MSRRIPQKCVDLIAAQNLAVAGDAIKQSMVYPVPEMIPLGSVWQEPRTIGPLRILDFGNHGARPRH